MSTSYTRQKYKLCPLESQIYRCDVICTFSIGKLTLIVIWNSQITYTYLHAYGPLAWPWYFRKELNFTLKCYCFRKLNKLFDYITYLRETWINCRYGRNNVNYLTLHKSSSHFHTLELEKRNPFLLSIYFAFSHHIDTWEN